MAYGNARETTGRACGDGVTLPVNKWLAWKEQQLKCIGSIVDRRSTNTVHAGKFAKGNDAKPNVAFGQTRYWVTDICITRK